MSVDPRNRPTSSRRRKGSPWVDVYHRQAKDVAMDLWELQAAKAAASGKKGAKKKAPRYPTRHARSSTQPGREARAWLTSSLPTGLV